MQKQPTQIIVYSRGKNYYCDTTGCYGGGYLSAFAGTTPQEVALFVLREKGRYIDNNPMGGSMYLPVEIKKAINKIANLDMQAKTNKGVKLND